MAAFMEIYRSGFQSADLESILTAAGVTKGALYHHFSNKEALGLAVVDEVLTGITREKWVDPLQGEGNMLDALKAVVEGTLLSAEAVAGGCPVNNLSQEMSPLDEEFRIRLAGVFRIWQDGIADALTRGIERGQVRADVDVPAAAIHLLATYEGYISLAKNAQDPRLLESGVQSMLGYLEALRNVPAKKKTGGR